MPRDAKRAADYQRIYRRDNKGRVDGLKQQRIAEQRAFIVAAKSKPCCDCGIQYSPWVMEFDHVRGKKKYIVSRLSRSISASWKTIKDEIAKCDIVCANCHRQRTYERFVASQRIKAMLGPPKPVAVGSTPTAGATLFDLFFDN